MFSWLKNLFKQESFYSNLPECARYNEDTGIIIVEHRGIKGYFTKDMAMEFKKSNVDFIQYFKESVDEFLDETEGEILDESKHW